MIDLRVMGQSEEVTAFVSWLSACLDVTSVSDAYPSRNSSDVRVYIKICAHNENALKSSLSELLELLLTLS